MPYNLYGITGEPWEEMCREHVRRLAGGRRLPVKVSSVGRWWNTDNSVKVYAVGLDGTNVVLAGSATWSASVGRNELNRLRRAVEALPSRAPEVQLVLFVRARAGRGPRRGAHVDGGQPVRRLSSW